MPADTPVTTPPLVTVAMLVLPLLHTPPVPAVSVVVPPGQTDAVPVIAAGNGCTVTVVVDLQVPPSE